MAHMPSLTSRTRLDGIWLGSPTAGMTSHCLPTASGPHRRVMPASAWPQVSAAQGLWHHKASACHLILVWSGQDAQRFSASVRLRRKAFLENIEVHEVVPRIRDFHRAITERSGEVILEKWLGQCLACGNYHNYFRSGWFVEISTVMAAPIKTSNVCLSWVDGLVLGIYSRAFQASTRETH